MQKALHFLAMCALLTAVTAPSASAANVIVGVNIYDEGALSQTDQDAEIDQLASNGVKTIRTCLCLNAPYFITKAFRKGIGSVVIVYPGNGTKIKSKWSPVQLPLSQADPEGFVEFYKPLLDKLETAGVHLVAIELGNEINSSGYNADIPSPGSGRVLGISDLDNTADPESAAIAKGFKTYLQVMVALRSLLDHSTLNKNTPIISAGMADNGLPSPKSWNKKTEVSMPDAIEFLRQNGMDRLAGGYGVHVYPAGDLNTPLSARIAQLERNIFAACRPGTKPCWLTEWGFGNSSTSCPINDQKRIQLIQAQHEAFKPFINQQRVAAMIYFAWDKDAIYSIVRCGALTDAGKLALRPM
jgi:hypothetical protein